MILAPLFRTVGRVTAVVGMLTGLLLLGGSRPATADGNEAPSGVVAFPNAPRMITVTWTHTGEGVYWFVLEQEAPFAFTTPDRDKRSWSVPNLEPNRTYRFRVCAVYDFNRVCSEWASVTTLPLPPPPPSAGSSPGSGGSAGAALPAAVAMPVLRAQRRSPMEVSLKWDLPPTGAVVLTRGTLYRDNQAIYEALQPGNYDSDHVDQLRQATTYRYQFCFEGPAFGKRCSAEVVVHGPVVNILWHNGVIAIFPGP